MVLSKKDKILYQKDLLEFKKKNMRVMFILDSDKKDTNWLKRSKLLNEK